MKLSKVTIKKFRAIHECEIQLTNELALVGQNSGGKSSVLRALNAFFNLPEELESFHRGRHQYQTNTTSLIQLEFVNVDPSCALPRTGPNNDQVHVRLKYRKKEAWEWLDGTTWKKAASDLQDELQKFVKFVYVPLRRDRAVAAWNEESLLTKAVRTHLAQYTSKRDRISPKVKKAAEHLKGHALTKLCKKLEHFFPLERDLKFSIDFESEPDYRNLLSSLEIRASLGATEVSLADWGSGTQNLTAFAIYSYLAELESTTYILGIEEPEQNLHPQAQRELIAALKDTPLQVLFTTHSTSIIDELNHEEVALCRRSSSTRRDVEVSVTQLGRDFWTRTGLDREKYYKFYQWNNSDFFFGSFVIVLEGTTDAAIVRELLSQTKAGAALARVSFLSLDGVRSLPYAYHLLNDLRIPFAMVVDKDYFLPYLNDEVDLSRNNDGFPRYKNTYQNSTLVDEVFPNPQHRRRLLTLLNSNHSQAMQMLVSRNVFCFRYSLEVDLVAATTARSLFYSRLNVQPSDRTTNELLVGRKKQIKKLETLLPIVQQLSTQNFPNSYKSIKRELSAKILAV